MQLWEPPHNWYLVFNNWCYPGVTLVSIYNYIFIAIHHFGIAFVKNRFTNGLLKLSTACLHMDSFNSWLAFVCVDINDKWACLKWKKAHSVLVFWYNLNYLLLYVYLMIWASLVAQMVKICLRCGRLGFDLWVRKIPWRREWQPTPVFLPGEFHGQRSLVGYSSWSHKESDMTEWLTQTTKSYDLRRHTILSSLFLWYTFKNCLSTMSWVIKKAWNHGFLVAY